MKTIKTFLIQLCSVVILITFGCNSTNSVKDNSGDNVHQEDEQDADFRRADSSRNQADTVK